MTTEYYYIDREGNIKGPASQSEFVRLGITPDTKVWRKGMSDWRSLAEVISDSQLSATNTAKTVSTPPPLPRTTPPEPAKDVSSNSNLTWIICSVIFFITLFIAVLGIGRGCNRNHAEADCDSDSCITTYSYDDYPTEAPAAAYDDYPVDTPSAAYDYDYPAPVADSCI